MDVVEVLALIGGAMVFMCGVFLVALKLEHLQVSLYFYQDFVITLIFAAAFMFLGPLLIAMAILEAKNEQYEYVE
jgi:hypothetical protein